MGEVELMHLKCGARGLSDLSSMNHGLRLLPEKLATQSESFLHSWYLDVESPSMGPEAIALRSGCVKLEVGDF